MRNYEISKEYEQTKMVAMRLLAVGYRETHPANSYLVSDTIKLPKIEKGSSIAGNIMKFKIPAYGIKIDPPDWLIYLIDICADSRPGFVQLIYKELLEFINNSRFNRHGIPANYKITAEDFANCFAIEFPIILNPKIEERYSKLWDLQKRKPDKINMSDNMCDTTEYWTSIITKEE